MNIKITPGNWQRRLLIAMAVWFYAEALSIARQKIRVHVKPVAGLRERAKCRGMAVRSGMNFYITVESRLGASELSRVLAHEMIHVAQWVRGDMRDLDSNRHGVWWKGRVYNPRKLPYRKHPWERQAYTHEAALFFRFRNFWKGR